MACDADLRAPSRSRRPAGAPARRNGSSNRRRALAPQGERMKKTLWFTAGLALAALTGAMAVRSSAQDDALDPLRVAGDTHKLAFENKFVRVLDVHLPPGKVEPRHRHPHGMSVYFTD